MPDLNFQVERAEVVSNAASPLLALKLRLSTSDPYETIHTFALHSPKIHPRRSSKTSRPFRRSQPLEPDSEKSALDPRQHSRAVIPGHNSSRSPGPVHFRFQCRCHKIFRRPLRWRSPSLRPVQRHGVLRKSARQLASRAHFMGQGNSIQAPGKSLARHDGILLSQQRLALPAQRRFRPSASIQGPARHSHLGRSD